MWSATDQTYNDGDESRRPIRIVSLAKTAAARLASAGRTYTPT
jgi:hypothetical protein